MNRRMQLLYVHDTKIGYARYGVKLADALQRQGVLIVDSIDPADRHPSHLVCWVSVPSHATGWHRGQHAVMSTMWEATVLPEAFREGLHNFAQIVVPSDQNVELFSRYHNNVVKVPLGVDTLEWAYRPRHSPLVIYRSGPLKTVSTRIRRSSVGFASTIPGSSASAVP